MLAVVAQKHLVFIAYVLLAVVLLCTGWLCDDAYITFRVVDNFLHGYGLTWNVGERVQVATHPLWLLVEVIACMLLRNIELTSLLLCLVCSLVATAIVLFSLSKSVSAACWATAAFVLSKTFVDYSSSGMENGLSHLCLGLFFVLYFSPIPEARRFGLSVVAASLVLLNRLDLSLLIGPPLVFLAIDLLVRKEIRFGQLVLKGMLGMLPVLLWLSFCVFYFGFAFPNSAYAKLGTGIPVNVLIGQGFSYLMHTLSNDPVTMVTIVLGLCVGITGRSWRSRAVSLGIAIYLLYVLKIGGCFMGGRFFTAPFFCSVLLIAHLFSFTLQRLAASVVVGMLLSIPAYLPVARAAMDDTWTYPLINAHNIHDEHALFHPYTGLLRHVTHPQVGLWGIEIEGRNLKAKAEHEGRQVYVEDNIGMCGFFAGPDVYVVDPAALSDVLLARLPQSGAWKIGHFYRPLPNGYLETLATGDNQISDPVVARLYEQLRLVTTGPLFSRNRWREIWRLNTGQP